MLATVAHEKSHLVIGDMSAGQRNGPLQREGRSITQPPLPPEQRLFRTRAAAGIPQVGLSRPSSSRRRRTVILIVAGPSSRLSRKSPSRGLNRESFKFRTIQRFIIAILALVTTPASTVRAQTRTTLKGNACPSETGRGILRDQSSNRRTVSTRSLANSRSTSSRVSHVSGSSQPGPANRAKKGSESRRKAEK